MTKEEQWDKFGYVVRDQIRFRLHVKDGSLDIVEDYLETDKKDLIDVNLPDAIGMTPLMWACQSGHEKVVAALLAAKADVGIADLSVRDEKVTALEYAQGWPHQEGCERHDPCVALIEEFSRTGKILALHEA
eukprot:CAMPEP_0177211958 /NCGR_PEP_ID=MMETSP0367-20130122/32373_1 /TAXON_ID=447022 ORGANISM="Scrippsiella hangoei-like, Strain SHHI-4" /NCGR_SAMPLE_ID=MMETSP0367 /ASSEMBLY_ACC=CAM_ASM_000362 /LENGTH=131 /DNA_ID=CAMNT_0018661185 /DNA_START=119 /DNA_END=514 /DNA_ORIENTATION=-